MGLSKDEHLQQIIQVKAELCKRSFAKFVKEFWEINISDELVWANHLEFLCTELEAVSRNLWSRNPKLYDLIINVPPGSSKSTLVSVMWPVWNWVNDESLRFITGSYAESLSLENAEYSRNILTSDKFRSYFPHIQLSNQNKVSNYRNTGNGQRFSCGAGGMVTGIHAHCIIIDDPLNPKQAVSDVMRDNANEWMDKTLSMRKVDKAVTVTVLVMQRLHELDCTGYKLAKGKDNVRHICLPAELSPMVSPIECREMYIDGLLDPKRLSRSVIEEAFIDLGSYGKAGQFDQNPAPADGGILKRSWFGELSFSEFTDKVLSSRKEVVWNFAIDCAYTAKESNDPSGILAYCMFENNLYLRCCECVRFEQPQLESFISDFVLKNGYTSKSRIFIEPKANGLSTAQNMKHRTNLNIVIDKAPTTDKEARTRDSAPFIESGRVILLSGSWTESFLSSLTMFPNGAHDEEVDILNIAIRTSTQTRKKLTWRK